MKNFERYVETKKMREDIEEGFALHNEDIENSKEEEDERIDKIIKLLFENHEDSFQEKIENFSQPFKLKIFDKILGTNYDTIFSCISYFAPLPYEYQEKIFQILKSENRYIQLHFATNIIKSFDKITHQGLTSFFLNPATSSQIIIQIIENKEKFPFVSDREFLNLLNWSVFVDVMHKFPYISKETIVKELLNNKNDIGTLVVNYKKLGLTERKLIDELFTRKHTFKIADKIKIIPEAYHQEIIEKIIEEGNAWSVLSSFHILHLPNIDIDIIINKILSITNPEIGSGKTGKDLIIEYIHHLPQNWLNCVPQKILDLIMGQDPEKIAEISNKLVGRIDKKEIVEKLILKRNFNCLFLEKEKLDVNIKTYPDFIEKHIKEIDFGFLVYHINIIKDFITKDNLPLVLSHLFLNLHYSFDDDNVDGENEFIPSLISGLCSEFNFPLDSLRAYISEEQENNIKIMGEKILNFETKIFSSSEIFFSFLSLKKEDVNLLITNNNLIETFDKNPAMAVKLLIKYPQFEDSVVENIDFILEAKRKILEYNPNIDPNSCEFRILMQKQLRSYKRNEDMVIQMKESGVDIDTWLNYSEEKTFELGGEETSYMELIRLPSKRIENTLKNYERIIQDILKEYKRELTDKKVSLVDISEIEQKILTMRNLCEEMKEKGEEDKVRGVERGIESLQKQIENGKEISVWMKIMSDIDLVKKTFDRVIALNLEIAQIDEENNTLGKEQAKESQKKMFDNKQKLEDKTQEFIKLLKVSSDRFDSLFNSIQKSLDQTLGKERSGEIINIMQDRLREDREHFNSDKTTLENILKVNDSDDDFKGALLNIKVWDRNPDIDLYMGNYSDCCVRIDSEYHGSESPISDYITDLGIQIVAVYDEKTGKPFAAAWCFVGVDESGNKAFVIDNIEAVGPYMKYKDLIETKLRDYIEKYAQKVGLNKISQGPDHNDLIVTTNIEEKYKKLGGYNRADGYYLEAEPDDEYGEDDDNEEDEGDENEMEDIETEKIDLEEEQRLIDEYSRTQENIVSIEEAWNKAPIR